MRSLVQPQPRRVLTALSMTRAAPGEDIQAGLQPNSLPVETEIWELEPGRAALGVCLCWPPWASGQARRALASHPSAWSAPQAQPGRPAPAWSLSEEPDTALLDHLCPRSPCSLSGPCPQPPLHVETDPLGQNRPGSRQTRAGTHMILTPCWRRPGCHTALTKHQEILKEHPATQQYSPEGRSPVTTKARLGILTTGHGGRHRRYPGDTAWSFSHISQ